MNAYKNIFFITIFIVMNVFQLSAQNNTAKSIMQKYEDSLIVLVDSMRNSYIGDEKVDMSFRFITLLKSALKQPNSYAYPFDSLKKIMHIIPSPDGDFKIFNWVVTISKVKKNYFGAVQLSDNSIIPLVDYSSQLEEQNNVYGILSNKQWYGGEYYRIMKDQINGKTVYLLFGFNSDSHKLNKKFVDVMQIDGNEIIFGAPIFKAPDNFGIVQLRNRFIQYYKKGVTITLNWDDKINAIVFNKLESDISAPSRLDTYVPTGQIDALKKQGSIWAYQPEALNILKLSDGKAPIDGVMN